MVLNYIYFVHFDEINEETERLFSFLVHFYNIRKHRDVIIGYEKLEEIEATIREKQPILKIKATPDNFEGDDYHLVFYATDSLEILKKPSNFFQQDDSVIHSHVFWFNVNDKSIEEIKTMFTEKFNQALNIHKEKNSTPYLFHIFLNTEPDETHEILVDPIHYLKNYLININLANPFDVDSYYRVVSIKNAQQQLITIEGLEEQEREKTLTWKSPKDIQSIMFGFSRLLLEMRDVLNKINK